MMVRVLTREPFAEGYKELFEGEVEMPPFKPVTISVDGKMLRLISEPVWDITNQVVVIYV